MVALRSPVCTCVGHVDHGKSSILDRIRGTTIVSREAGGITQSIGASIVPMKTIKQICGSMLDAMKIDFTIPSLLFIDTPGHAAFTNLRKRGGNLADIAVLVIDIKEGFMPQTIEALEILKGYKTPFVIAANKIDLLEGFKSNPQTPLLKNIANQAERTVYDIENKVYEIIGKLSEFGVSGDRFDRVSDFTKQVALIPCSAKTGEGIPELLMVIAGLAQRYLEASLKLDSTGPGKGTILEVKEEQGLGTTLNVIFYDGMVHVNDTIVIGNVGEPIVTRVKALLEPASLGEMRDKKCKFTPVKSVHAAIGVKIAAPDLDGVIGGMPVQVATKDTLEKVKAEISSEISEVLISTQSHGVILKADTLGGLEALSYLLKEKNIPIKRASIGHISKKDISDAEANFDKDPLESVILGFNIELPAEVPHPAKVKIITHPVIYHIIDEYEKWKQEKSKNIESMQLDVITRPCKFQILANYIFRQSNPAVCGVEVLLGTLRSGTKLMNSSGKVITSAKGIQHEKENVKELSKGKQAALSMDGITIGRQVNGDEFLYSAITENEFRTLKELKKFLSPDEVEALKEIVAIMRKENPVWGV